MDLCQYHLKKNESFLNKRILKREFFILVTLDDLYFGNKRTFILDQKSYELQLQPGFKEGTKIVFDHDHVSFIIKQEKHPIFERHGDDLKTIVEIKSVDYHTNKTSPLTLLNREIISIPHDWKLKQTFGINLFFPFFFFLFSREVQTNFLLFSRKGHAI